MADYSFTSIPEFQKAFERHMRERERRIFAALRHTANTAARIIRANTPAVTHELRDSVHVEPLGRGLRVAIDAPYAAAVEFGSRPHWVPLDALIAWVKAKGAMGLSRTGRVRKGAAIAGQLAEHVRSRAGPHTPVDAPKQIARAIQAVIAREGTKPHWYVKKSMPEVETVLDREMVAALPDR